MEHVPYAFQLESAIGKAQRNRATRPDRRAATRTGFYSRFVEISRVTRVGAFTLGRHKKLPWVRVESAELVSRLPAEIFGSTTCWALRLNGRKRSATFPRDERDWFRLPMPHRARDTCGSKTGTKYNSDLGNRRGHPSRQTLKCTAAQRSLKGEGLSPGHELRTSLSVGAT